MLRTPWSVNSRRQTKFCGRVCKSKSEIGGQSPSPSLLRTFWFDRCPLSHPRPSGFVIYVVASRHIPFASERHTGEGSRLRPAVAGLQRAKQPLPASECAQVAKFVAQNDDSWISESFKQGMADTEGGRFVDLDAALTGRVPRRSMKYRFRVIHSYAGTSRLCPVISGGCFI